MISFYPFRFLYPAIDLRVFIVLISFLFYHGIPQAQDALHLTEGALDTLNEEDKLPVLGGLVEAYASKDAQKALSFAKEGTDLLRRYPSINAARQIWFWKGMSFYHLKIADSILVTINQLDHLPHQDGIQGDKWFLEGLLNRLNGSDSLALISVENALIQYESGKDHDGIKRSMHEIGDMRKDLGDYEAAIVFFKRLLELELEDRDSVLVARTYTDIGNVESRMGNYPEALQAYLSSLNLKEALGDRRAVGMTQMNIGNIYYNQADYAKALEYFMQALDIDEEFKDDQRIARTLNNIGGVYFSTGSYSKAIDFFQRSLDYKEKLNDQRGIANSLSNIGEGYRALGELDQAIVYFERALSIDEKLGDKWGIAYSLENIGNVYLANQSYRQALGYFEKSLPIRRDIGDQRGQASTLLSIGISQRELDKLDEAKSSLEEALMVAQKINSRDQIMNTYEALSSLYEKAEKYKEALEMYKSYKSAYDSLFNSQSEGLISDLQEKYRTKEQEQQIELLEQSQQIQRLWVGGLVLGCTFLIVIVFLAYNRYRFENRAHNALAKVHNDLRDTHEKLKATQLQLIHTEKMASLGQLTAGIAHEIKNPLNFVNNFAEINNELTYEIKDIHKENPNTPLSEIMDVISDIGQNSSLIQQHGQRADGIVRSMMQHASGSKGHFELTDLNALVSDHIDFTYHAKKADISNLKIHIIKDFDERIGLINIMKQGIGRVLINIIGNAIDAVHEYAQSREETYEARLSVKTEQTEEGVKIIVSDNGPGMDKDIQQKIFEPFFTTKSLGKGTGLGLSLSYDIITKGHGGSITVDSAKGQGTAFTIIIPYQTNTPTDPETTE